MNTDPYASQSCIVCHLVIYTFNPKKNTPSAENVDAKHQKLGNDFVHVVESNKTDKS